MNENDEDSGYLGALLGAGIGAPLTYYAARHEVNPLIEAAVNAKRLGATEAEKLTKKYKKYGAAGLALLGALKGAWVGNEVQKGNYGDAGLILGALGGMDLVPRLAKTKFIGEQLVKHQAAPQVFGLAVPAVLAGAGYGIGKYLEPYKDPLGDNA